MQNISDWDVSNEANLQENPQSRFHQYLHGRESTRCTYELTESLESKSKWIGYTVPNICLNVELRIGCQLGSIYPQNQAELYSEYTSVAF